MKALVLFTGCAHTLRTSAISWRCIDCAKALISLWQYYVLHHVTYMRWRYYVYYVYYVTLSMYYMEEPRCRWRCTGILPECSHSGRKTCKLQIASCSLERNHRCVNIILWTMLIEHHVRTSNLEGNDEAPGLPWCGFAMKENCHWKNWYLRGFL